MAPLRTFVVVRLDWPARSSRSATALGTVQALSRDEARRLADAMVPRAERPMIRVRSPGAVVPRLLMEALAADGRRLRDA